MPDADYDAAVEDISRRLEDYLDGLAWYGRNRSEAMVDSSLDALIGDLRDIVKPKPRRPRPPRTRITSPGGGRA